MGVERPPGDDEDQFPAVDALRRALRRGVRDGANSDVDGLNALVLEWGIVRTLAGPPDARHWVGHAATPGWGPALAASTIPPVLDLHASGAITRARLVCFPLVRAALPAAETWASTTVLLRAVRELGASVARSPWHRTALREGTELPT